MTCHPDVGRAARAHGGGDGPAGAVTVITERVTVYRAPVKGAPRRMTMAAAYRDWAKYIIRTAPCKHVPCTEPEPEVNWPGTVCSRHYPAPGWQALVDRVARLLEYQERCR